MAKAVADGIDEYFSLVSPAASEMPSPSPVEEPSE